LYDLRIVPASHCAALLLPYPIIFPASSDYRPDRWFRKFFSRGFTMVSHLWGKGRFDIAADKPLLKTIIDDLNKSAGP
jgi:hypothetical protein